MTKSEQLLQLMELMDQSPAPIGATALSEQTGIPPATVGRMLAKLEEEKMLTKVSNRGRCLTETGRRHLSNVKNRNSKLTVADKLINLVQDVSKEQLYEVLETRLLLESHTARLAAQNATLDHIGMLEDIMFDYTYELKHGDTGSESDLRLHLCIAKVAGNATIYQILKLVLQEDNVYARFSAAADQLANEQILQHRAIVEAIREKNPPAAVEAMSTHLKKVMRDVELYY